MPATIKSYKLPSNELLHRTPFFSELGPEDIEWFLERARFVEYPKKSFLFQRGDRADFMYIMMEGWIKLFQNNQEGEETVQAILTRYDSFGEETALEEYSYLYNAQVASNSAKCLIIPASAIRERIKSDHKVAMKILTALTHHMAQMGLMYDHMTRLTAAQRVSAFILKLSMDRGYAKIVKLPYNKLLIAARLCMQPETFSRAIKRLEEDTRAKIKGREVFIEDVEELQDYCEVYCCKEKECSVNEKLSCSDRACDLFRFLKLM